MATLFGDHQVRGCVAAVRTAAGRKGFGIGKAIANE
jgi:hypothetical protein